jgi:hypothetical protein
VEHGLAANSSAKVPFICCGMEHFKDSGAKMPLIDRVGQSIAGSSALLHVMVQISHFHEIQVHFYL